MVDDILQILFNRVAVIFKWTNFRRLVTLSPLDSGKKLLLNPLFAMTSFENVCCCVTTK